MIKDLQKQKRVLRVVERIWKKVPSLRLMQLLSNCFDQEDVYYVSDIALEDRLRIVYKEYL